MLSVSTSTAVLVTNTANQGVEELITQGGVVGVFCIFFMFLLVGLHWTHRKDRKEDREQRVEDKETDKEYRQKRDEEFLRAIDNTNRANENMAKSIEKLGERIFITRIDR